MENLGHYFKDNGNDRSTVLRLSSGSTCKAARFCSQNYDRYASVTDMIKDLGWTTLETRRRQSRLTLMYKLTNGLTDIDTRKCK